eukprot:348887-Amphidinium_carterae.1
MNSCRLLGRTGGSLLKAYILPVCKVHALYSRTNSEGALCFRACLAIPCKQAQALQRMQHGMHWELGRWANHPLPYDQGLHISNVYGYSSDNERAPELNRELCFELFGVVAALVNRPLSSVRYASPQGEVQTDWIL